MKPLGKHLHRVYEDLSARYALTDGIARRVAILAARSWLEHETVGRVNCAVKGIPMRGLTLAWLKQFSVAK